MAQIRVPLSFRASALALFGLHPRQPFPWSLSGTWRDPCDLREWIRGDAPPVVASGDFNAPPGSAVLDRLRRLGLVNASEAVLGRAPATWPMRPPSRALLRVAIDHVLHVGDFVALAFGTGAQTNSDHAAVFADLVWRRR